jgi:transposase
MPRGPKPTPITLTDDERAKLSDWARRPTIAQRLALRARIALAAAGGHANAAIAAQLRVTVPTVHKWRDRFSEKRLEGLVDEPRPGAPRTITDQQVEAAVTRTLESKPTDATHWSTRTLARELDLSQTAVVRIWHAFGLNRLLPRPLLFGQ